MTASIGGAAPKDVLEVHRKEPRRRYKQTSTCAWPEWSHGPWSTNTQPQD